LAKLAHKRHTKSRPVMRLGNAAFVQPHGEAVAARQEFLKVIERLAPQVLDPFTTAGVVGDSESLAACVLPHYEADDVTRCDHAKVEWARRFHLTQNGEIPPWLALQVSKTLSLWMYYPGTRGSWSRLVPALVQRNSLPPELENLSIQLSGAGGAGGESLQDVRRRLSDEAIRKIDTHLDRVTARARAMGLKEPTEFRRPEHFEWAVRFQVNEEPVPSIAGDKEDRG
jgi:hypothetical protein